MTPDTLSLEILLWVGGSIGTAIISLLLWLVKKNIDKVDNHDNRIEKLENTTVTSDQVRSIIHQSNQPLVTSITELKKDIATNTQVMNMVLQEIAERRGYDRAFKDMRGSENG